MKKRFSLILMAIMLMGSIAVQAQQTTKFGHIDTNELLRMMPGRDAATQEMEKYTRELEAQYVAMQTEFQNKYQEYLEKQATFSDLIRQARERELQNLQERIVDFQESAQQDLMDKERSLLSPIIEQARTAITEVAKENGFTYVFDTSTGTLLFWEAGENIMPMVRQKLGI